MSHFNSTSATKPARYSKNAWFALDEPCASFEKRFAAQVGESESPFFEPMILGRMLALGNYGQEQSPSVTKSLKFWQQV